MKMEMDIGNTTMLHNMNILVVDEEEEARVTQMLPISLVSQIGHWMAMGILTNLMIIIAGEKTHGTVVAVT